MTIYSQFDFFFSSFFQNNGKFSMNNVLLRIKEMRLALAPCEELVADYILNNVKDACDTNIRVLSAMTNTSPSSIARLCRKLGFDGFQDFSKSFI